MTERYNVMLDAVCYESKPERREIGSITRRLQRGGPCEVTMSELARAIRQGRTWMAGTFEPSGHGWGAFVGMRVWALDIDNHSRDRQLTPSDKGFIWPEGIRERLVSLGFRPLMCHSTAHATKDAVRFRTIFDLGECITDENEAKELVSLVLKRFPECDKSCSNINRLSFGAKGCGLYPYWQGGEVWPS